jgi:hypothetical protein
MFFLTRRAARRLGPIGVALTLYDIWNHIPKKEQRRLIALGQKQGTRSLELIRRESARISSRFA